MRTITDHTVEGDSANHQLTIEVTDEPGQGGANHEYQIRWNPKPEADAPGCGHSVRSSADISFQNGPIKEFGVNGLTQEVLLAIVIDRLRSFQAGPFACDDNAVALEHCGNALFALQNRTHARIARGVEGTHEK